MHEKGKEMARLKVRLALKWFTRSGVQDKVWRAFATQETSAYQAGNPPPDTPPAAQENIQLKRTNKRCVECNVLFCPPGSLSWCILPWTPVWFELWTADLPGGSNLQTCRKIDVAVIDKFPAGARLLSLRPRFNSRFSPMKPRVVGARPQMCVPVRPGWQLGEVFLWLNFK